MLVVSLLVLTLLKGKKRERIMGIMNVFIDGVIVFLAVVIMLPVPTTLSLLMATHACTLVSTRSPLSSISLLNN